MIQEGSKPPLGSAIRMLDHVPVGQHFQSAELVRISWRTAAGLDHSECAILAEVSTSGGLVLVDAPIEPETMVRIALPHAIVTGVVSSCSREESAWALRVAVNASADWFGGTYRPEVLLPEDGASQNSAAPFQAMPATLFTSVLKPAFAQ